MTGPPRPVTSVVVFDLGGVLVDWDPRRLYRTLLPEAEVDPFLAEIGFAEWNAAADAGRLWAVAVEELSARHPHRRELIEAYPARFLDTLGGTDDDVVAILDDLRRAGTRLFALTNWSDESFEAARSVLAFLDRFEGIVVSGREGVAKPDPRLFQILADRHALTPAETVFVDDSDANVRSARSLGYDAVHFRGAEQLRRELSERGLLGAGGCPAG